MCGRFALSAPAENIRKHFGLREELCIEPRFNISPGQQISVVRQKGDGEREFAALRWGLIPFWAKEKGSGFMMINARAETVEEKPSFRTSFKKYRCLIPTNGFFEWKKVPGRKKKQPYFIQLHNCELFSMAGLWSSWTDKISGKEIESCAIITTVPNALLRDIHDRMPVILPPAGYSGWLDKQSSPAALGKMLVPFDQRLMKYFPVSDICNSAGIDTPECVRSIDT